MTFLRRRGTIRAPDGFTFVESMLALAIGTFAMLAVGALLAGAMMNASVAEEITAQTVDASSQVERLLARAWDDPVLRAGGDLERCADGYCIDPVDGDPDRYIRWQITDEGTAFKRISLVAGLRRSALASREVRFDTFRRRTEPEE